MTKKKENENIEMCAVSSSNCEKCVYFRYEASWGHGWCYNDKSYLSGKIRGSGKSCTLDTSKL
jgi:hypothetical protein